MSTKVKNSFFSIGILVEEKGVSVNVVGEPFIPLLSGKKLPIESVAFDNDGVVIKTNDGMFHKFKYR